MQKETEWARHLPSEGEREDEQLRNRTREGVEATARQHQQEAGMAPAQADSDAADENREFVEDAAMKYDDAESAHAKDGESRQGG